MANASKTRTVTVGTTAVSLTGSNASRRSVRFKNKSAATVYLSGTGDVTASGVNEGWELAAGAEYTDAVTHDAIFAIVAAGTADVKVWEFLG